MAETRPPSDAAHEAPVAPAAETFDREIDRRSIWGFAVAVTAVTLLVHLIVWGMMASYRRTATGRDPAPSPLAEANVRRLPPVPRLQNNPEAAMARLRAREEAQLTTYGWIDRAAGVGRIPIERAIDLLIEQGLPGAGAPAGSPAGDRPSPPGGGPPAGRRGADAGGPS